MEVKVSIAGPLCSRLPARLLAIASTVDKPAAEALHAPDTRPLRCAVMCYNFQESVHLSYTACLCATLYNSVEVTGRAILASDT
jgi:hypothetical protein